MSTFVTSNRPVVHDTHSQPFKSLDGGHKTMPDITISRPGLPVDLKLIGWAHAGTVIELKWTTDIFDAEGIHDSKRSRDALVQLAKSARSLLMASGGCHVYVVACFNKGMARILRFDRAGFRVTHPFDWLDETSTVFPTFFYRLYNPAGHPSRMDGDDYTIRPPTVAEKKLMYHALCKHEDYARRYTTLKKATEHSRCITAVRFVTEDNKRVPKLVDCFTIGSDISYMDGLFGRATRVYRVILKEDFEKEKPTIYALKDAWRQTCRRPELDFYDAIAAHCKASQIDMDKEGMAQCHGSIDLSADDVPPGATWKPALHLTRSSKGGPELERRHTRTLLTPVGTPLKFFTSTKSLAMALYRVVWHHRIAYDAGVIHRDISDGNVLFGGTVEGTREAFLVDWDYAEFTEDGLRLFHKAFPEREEQTRLYQSIDKSLKDLTGTLPFVAIKIIQNMVAEKETLHAAEHDLESVYWLLIWMILRHTHHGRREGDMACSKLFDENRKVEWFHTPQFTPTEPLFRLATDLGRHVKRQNPAYDSEVPAVQMTHAKVLETFDTYLKAADWPTNDPALPFGLPSIRSDKQEKAESLHQLAVKGASRAPAKRNFPWGDDDEASPTVASASSLCTTAVSSGSKGPSASKKRKGMKDGRAYSA
ncbi:hypothetical protein GGX14DRAFT_374842 [Mycena pura]|uniref:Fungal-type protein kinase domain-containing protein n=1 Tax=Mycena pura TaxID=153505 RepID=A0AAD6V260_9AGAR|nr:hypothetical protein GGX14DRAFT_383616 [Mycena pura]KAJ7197647.1 hypothetical protein GGX14DRAFT_374842 [Mycena pura]